MPRAALASGVARHSRAIRSVAAVASANLTSSLLGVLGGLMVARFLGPDQTGLFRSYTIPLTYLMVLHLGTFDGLQRQIPYHFGKGAPERAEALASAAGAWNLGVSGVVSCGFVCCAIVATLRRDAYGVAAWLAQAVACWGIFYTGYLGATYRTISQFVALARIQTVQAAVNFAAVALVPFLRFYGLCARTATASLVGLWLYHRHRPLRTPYRLRMAPLREVVGVGLPFSIWGSLTSSVWYASENALMLALGGVTGLGLFSVAAVLREGMTVLPQAVSQVLMPRIVEAYARENSVRRANARSLWVTFWLTGAMAVLVLAVARVLDAVVPIAIPKYAGGLPLMKLCLWFSVVQAAALPFNTLFATGRSWLYGRGVIVALVVFPVSAYLLSPRLGGVLAVATGSLLGRVARTAVAYLEIVRLTRREGP
jgi:O-antigen/teichoic acid export membrane protein